MSKQELTEVEELRRENQKLRNVAESHKIARDYALRTAEQLREELNYKVRCRVLEQLCHDLWLFACVTGSGGAERAFEQRMNALGLLDGEQKPCR